MNFATIYITKENLVHQSKGISFSFHQEERRDICFAYMKLKDPSRAHSNPFPIEEQLALKSKLQFRFLNSVLVVCKSHLSQLLLTKISNTLGLTTYHRHLFTILSKQLIWVWALYIPQWKSYMFAHMTKPTTFETLGSILNATHKNQIKTKQKILCVWKINPPN